MGTFGNSFDNTSQKWGHARKVWREIRHRYPAGAKITNVSEFVNSGVIPAGSAVKFDAEKKEMTVVLDSAIKAASDVKTLGVNGYLQEDVRVLSANTVATGTVIYAGEIYEYMFDADVVAKLKTLTTVPQIVWVQ